MIQAKRIPVNYSKDPLPNNPPTSPALLSAPRTFFSSLLRSFSCIRASFSLSLAKPLIPLFLPAPFFILASSPNPLPDPLPVAIVVEEEDVVVLAVDSSDELVVARRRSDAGTLKDEDEPPAVVKARRLDDEDRPDEALRLRLIRSTTTLRERRETGE